MADNKDSKHQDTKASSADWVKALKDKHVLVTGGTGYIGSHIAVELLNVGANVTMIDSLERSTDKCLERIFQITKRRPVFHKVEMCDEKALRQVFKSSPKFDSVIHLAGYKAVGESTEIPVRYYENNVGSSMNLLNIMAEFEVFSLVFSSSCTVYGSPEQTPVTEATPLKPTNPYGRSKQFIEEICRDVALADKRWRIVLLRYFNPIGAHPSGLLGEDPKGIPNNLLPYVSQVAMGQREFVNVFGGDYATEDGTGVRDYVHVIDVSLGHLISLVKVESGCVAYNLGRGQGSTVLQVIRAMEKASGKTIPYKIAPRRPGDVGLTYANVAKANKELGWVAEFDLYQAMVDTWRWQVNNPKGYE